MRLLRCEDSSGLEVPVWHVYVQITVSDLVGHGMQWWGTSSRQCDSKWLSCRQTKPSCWSGHIKGPERILSGCRTIKMQGLHNDIYHFPACVLKFANNFQLCELIHYTILWLNFNCWELTPGLKWYVDENATAREPQNLRDGCWILVPEDLSLLGGSFLEEHLSTYKWFFLPRIRSNWGVLQTTEDVFAWCDHWGCVYRYGIWNSHMFPPASGSTGLTGPLPGWNLQPLNSKLILLIKQWKAATIYINHH